MDKTLIINDRLPGFVRTKHVDRLLSMLVALEMAGAHHLASTLRDACNALLSGQSVRVTTGPRTTPEDSPALTDEELEAARKELGRKATPLEVVNFARRARRMERAVMAQRTTRPV